MEELEKYAQLEDIRKKLWMNDGKSRVSLMVGAGFSRNASKLDSSLKDISLWNDLKKKLIKDLGDQGKHEDQDVLDLGDEYVKEFGIISLENLLKKEVPDENYEPNHLFSELLELPFSDIYTTNYDTLLERSSKNIFNRHYEIIYNIHDIPGSISPRIVKLHGSFPSNRPFIFTKSDYDSYPKKSAPFINMVQQSIMETTMILIGFSCNDPNFEKWIDWVSTNLGEHRQKIYLLDIDIDESSKPFSTGLISGIDFKYLYTGKDIDLNYACFFEELFKYLSINPNTDKRKWPYQSYYLKNSNSNSELIELLKNNRITYPGWVIMPHRVSNRNKMYHIISSYFPSLNAETDYAIQVLLATEIVWAMKNFRIPLDHSMQKLLEEIAFNEKQENTDESVVEILLFLLKESRFDNNKLFFEITSKLKNKILTDSQKDELNYQLLLWKKDKNEDDIYKNTIQEWEIADQALDYKLKKATLLLEVNKVEEGIHLIKEVLRNARRILTIDRKNYFALSVEGIALKLLQRFVGSEAKEDYFNRFIVLDQDFCDPTTTINYVANFKKYTKSKDIEEKRTFDGKKLVTQKFSHHRSYGELSAFFLMTTYEDYLLGLESIDNLEVIKYLQQTYPILSLKKFFSLGEKEQIEEFFSKELVLSFSNFAINELFIFLKNTINNKTDSNLTLVFDVLYRLYFVLDKERQEDLDSLLLEEYSSGRLFYLNMINSNELFEMCLTRVLKSKYSFELEKYINQIYELPFMGEVGTSLENAVLDDNLIFHPLQFVSSKALESFDIKVQSERYTVSKLLELLKTTNTQFSIRMGVWQKLVFLEKTKNLSNSESAEIKKVVRKLIKSDDPIFNNYHKSFAIISFVDELPLRKKTMENLLNKGFKESYFQGITFGGNQLQFGLNEISNLMINTTFDKSIYQQLIANVGKWWNSQYRELKNDSDYFFKNNDVQSMTIFLKNVVFRHVKKEFFNADMIRILNTCYDNLKEDNDPLFYLLIPGILKINSSRDSDINELMNGMLSSDKKVLSNSIKAIQDLAYLKERKEIEINVRNAKVLLLQLFSVHKEASLLDVSIVISLILKEKPNFFTNIELNDISQKVRLFFEMYVEKTEQDVFDAFALTEIIINYLKIVQLLKDLKIDIDHERWLKWSAESIHPEIKRYSFIL